MERHKKPIQYIKFTADVRVKTQAMGSKELSIDLQDNTVLMYNKTSGVLRVLQSLVSLIIFKWKKFRTTKMDGSQTEKIMETFILVREKTKNLKNILMGLHP